MLLVWEKIREPGFEGSYSAVKHFAHEKKKQLNKQEGEIAKHLKALRRDLKSGSG